jgi:hypothetical protein
VVRGPGYSITVLQTGASGDRKRVWRLTIPRGGCASRGCGFTKCKRRKERLGALFTVIASPCNRRLPRLTSDIQGDLKEKQGV